MILGIIVLLLVILNPTLVNAAEVMNSWGRPDAISSPTDIRNRSIGGESLWTRDSSLNTIPRTLTNIWQGLWVYNGSASISPQSTISVGLWKINSDDTFSPNGTYDIDGLWSVNSSGDISPRG